MLVDEDTNTAGNNDTSDVPMFYPKNNRRGASRWQPRRLQANEVFLLLGKANNDLMEVLTVPWDPVGGVGGDYSADSAVSSERFDWPWAYLYTVHELAEMFKATKRICTQQTTKRSMTGQSSSTTAHNAASLFDEAALLETFAYMHNKEKDPDEIPAASAFFKALLVHLDTNGDAQLHLAELLGPLGALDIDLEMTAENDNSAPVMRKGSSNNDTTKFPRSSTGKGSVLASDPSAEVRGVLPFLT